MKYIFKALDWIEEIAMVIGMLIMVIVNFLNVVARYLMPQSPFSFTEELTVLLFVWVTMFGIACGYKRHSHTGLTLITDMLPKTLQRVFILLATLASAVLMCFLIYLGWEMVQSQINYGQIMTALKIPEAVAGFSIPIGGALILVRVVHTGIIDFINFGKEDPETGATLAEGEV